MSKHKAAGKWKADGPGRANTASSIRGKISAPIPIDDDEFPIRSPGTGIATPLGTEGVDKQLALPGRTSIGSGRPESPVNRGMSATVSSARPSYEVPGPVRRMNQPSNLRNSVISKVESNEGPPRERKKSSLRSALGKLFGKKRKSTVLDTNTRPAGNGLRNGQHHSVPTTAPKRSSPNPTFSPKRSASLPINDFNRALRSHSPGPDNFPLPDSENERESESIQTDGNARPRRATTPSRLYTPTKTPGYVDWTGLSPRPASSHARGSKVLEDEDPDVEAIGFAVTKGSHPNRRSRSLGQMRDAALAQTGSRRRSDEIRYWRQSYDPGALSPMSSNKPENEELLLVDPPEVLQDDEPQEPPQPFNFGIMGEMAGMKITQAASLETRVSRLEERMLQMEKSVSQIQHDTQSSHLQLVDAPTRGPRKDVSAGRGTKNTESPLAKHQTQQLQGSTVCGSQDQLSSYGSSRPSTTSTSNSQYLSYDESSSPPSFLTPSPNTASQDTGGRPLSTSTTIRGYPPSSPARPKDDYLTMEHYKSLTNMIIAEQTARQNLEAIVQRLQKQLLQALQPPLSTYPNARSHHMGDSTTMGGESFSSFEQDDSSDEEGRYGTEDFMTPREEHGQFGGEDEVFGGPPLSNGGEAKGTSRTLSLSQMTMKTANCGPRQQPSMNF